MPLSHERPKVKRVDGEGTRKRRMEVRGKVAGVGRGG
jgi:hypothetical protein